jgi:site-specific DNA-methyltransferase (adenine-specific)
MELNNFYNEDCSVTMSKMKDHFVDLVLTSPPYNMTKRKGGYADKQNRYDEYLDWKSDQEYIKWTIDIFNEFDRVLKKNKIILYNFSYSIENPVLPYQIVSEINSKTNFTIADTIIWKKSNAIPHPASYNRLNRIIEFIFVFVKTIII